MENIHSIDYENDPRTLTVWIDLDSPSDDDLYGLQSDLEEWCFDHDMVPVTRIGWVSGSVEVTFQTIAAAVLFKLTV